MPTPLPPAALDAAAPTSRSTFRLLARCVDATNREADTLRHALLAQWAEATGVDDLASQLRVLDRADPAGELGVEARLGLWFTHADPGDGRIVDAGDAVVAGVSDELTQRLAGLSRPGDG